jgi:RNA polymerase sigma-70 factor (ECF subfamily)
MTLNIGHSNMTGENSRTQQQPVNPDCNSEPFSRWLDDVADKRDKQAFSRLFEYFAPRIFAIARGKLNSEMLAKEVVQDCMTNVWRKAHLFDDEKGSGTTWVYTVMRNVIFDTLRKIKTNSKCVLSDDIYPLYEAIDEVEDVQESFMQSLRHNQLAAMVEQLPAAQQQVVKGIYYQELTHEQLAAQLNIPLGTVKSRLRLALSKLKDRIGEDHD